MNRKKGHVGVRYEKKKADDGVEREKERRVQVRWGKLKARARRENNKCTDSDRNEEETRATRDTRMSECTTNKRTKARAGLGTSERAIDGDYVAHGEDSIFKTRTRRSREFESAGQVRTRSSSRASLRRCRPRGDEKETIKRYNNINN